MSSPILFLALLATGPQGAVPQVDQGAQITEAGGTPLTDIDGVAVTRSGAVWIGQPMDGRVIRLNASGKFLGSIGRRGPGPGEFDDLEDVYAKGDSVLVIDGRERSTSIFYEGELVDTWRPFSFRDTPEEIGLPVAPSGIFADGTVLVERRTLARHSTPEIPLARIDPEAGFRNLITTAYRGESLSRARDEETGIEMFYRPPIHDGDLWQVAPGEDVIVLVRRPYPEGDSARAEVRLITNEGDLLRTIRLTAPAREVHPAAFDSVLNDYAERATRNRPFSSELLLKMLRDATPRPDRYPLVDGLFVDACLRLWLRESTLGASGSRWFLYSWSGEPLGTIRLPPTTRPSASTLDSLWAEGRLELGEPVLTRYEISREGCTAAQ